MSGAAPIAVVERAEFLSATVKLMSEEERTLPVDYLAHNPVAGDSTAQPVEKARVEL